MCVWFPLNVRFSCGVLNERLKVTDYWINCLIFSINSYRIFGLGKYMALHIQPYTLDLNNHFCNQEKNQQLVIVNVTPGLTYFKLTKMAPEPNHAHIMSNYRNCFLVVKSNYYSQRNEPTYCIKFRILQQCFANIYSQ